MANKKIPKNIKKSFNTKGKQRKVKVQTLRESFLRNG